MSLPGRTPVRTRLVSDARRDEVIERIRSAVASGRQAYWVCPLIEESEKLQLQTALDTHAMLSQELEGLRVGLVHGRLKADEKAATMASFAAGDIDVLVFASAPESPMVQMLLQTPGVRLMDFAQNEAYGRRFPFLSPVTLPRGVVDLAANVPPADVRLVASTTALLAREGTHPALLQLFAQNAQTLHGAAGWFNRAREYPTTRLSEPPIAEVFLTLQYSLQTRFFVACTVSGRRHNTREQVP